jgi:archaemetzincin
MAVLSLVPIYVTDRRKLLDPLGEDLERAFGLEVRIQRPWFDPEVPFDPSRGQYNSTVFLAQLLRGHAPDAVRVLGVTSVDLFVPVLTFVYGEAQLDGRVAVASLHRLRAEAYGLPQDDSLLYQRLLKESVHELGHTYGLIHCTTPGCVMQPSTYVEEIDLKTAEFCRGCRSRTGLP